MAKVTIKRAYLPSGTFGDLYVNDRFLCHTVERPWINNKAGLSCIPEGVYSLEKYLSPSHGESYIVSGGMVEKFKNNNGNRWGILFHTANLPRQLAGCIAPVSHLGILKGQYGGLSSQAALEKLFLKLQTINTLEITYKTACLN